MKSRNEIREELEKNADKWKKNLFDNIEELERIRGIDRGVLETSIGVSVGRLSKRKKVGGDIAMEHVINLAETLQVSVHNLVYGKLSEENIQTEKYVIDYLTKVIEDTKSGAIVWTTGNEKEFETKEKDIAQEYMDDFETIHFPGAEGSLRNLVKYYRGKCKDNREIILTNSVDIFDNENRVWDYTVFTRYHEDYCCDGSYYKKNGVNRFVIYSMLTNKRKAIYAKNKELINCIERRLRDVFISADAMREIDMYLGE